MSGFGGFGGSSGGFGGASSGGGNPFGGGFGGGEMMGSSNGNGDDMEKPTTGGNAPGGDANYEYNFGDDSEGDLESLLRQSPFGPLLDIPGVDGVEDIFGNVGGGTGGGNPFGGGDSGSDGGGAGMENPFANFNPLEDGNPFVEGDEPNIPEFGGGAPADDSDDAAGGGNPFGGNPFEYNPTGEQGENAYDFGDGSEIPAFNEQGEIDLPSGDSIPVAGNPFAGEEIAINIDSGDYLLKNADDSWYLSSDETVGDDDQLLFEGSNPFASGSSSFAGGEDSSMSGNPFAGEASSFASGENPFAGGDAPLA